MDTSIDSVLSSVMGNEDLMNKIKEVVQGNAGDTSSSLEDVISLIAPSIKANTNSETTKNDEIIDTGAIKNDNNSLISSLGKSISKNASLLIALKPYLSKERGQMIDSIVKISKITDTLKLL